MSMLSGSVSVGGSVAGAVGGAVGAVAAGVGAVSGAVGIDIGGVITDALLNAKIIPIMPFGTPVVFSYNPKDLTWTRTASKKQQKSAAGKPQLPQWTGSGPRTLSFTAYLEGPQAYPFATQLLQMMTPDGGLLGALGAMVGIGGGGIKKAKPAEVLFQWGPVLLKGFMTKCTITYERFHISGVPLRAKCAITLTEIPTSIFGTNPTSGGLPGREQHTLVDGESLAGVAHQTYGQPGRWRAVAQANEIDDPFAVRAGTNVYLPAPEELQQRER